MANKSINKFNVAAINQSGKVGTIRYYQRGGETYVRSSWQNQWKLPQKGWRGGNGARLRGVTDKA